MAKALIDSDCAFSFEHFVSGKNADDLLIGVDETFINIMKDVSRELLIKIDLDEKDSHKVAKVLVIAGLCYYHLFRIQKESDDLC